MIHRHAAERFESAPTRHGGPGRIRGVLGAGWRVLISAVIVAVSVSAAVIIPSSAAGAASNGEWSMAPYSAPGTSLPRAFFDFTLHPGQSISDKAELSNYTTNTLSFHVYPSDGMNVKQGGAFGLLLPSNKMKFVGAWVTSSVTYYSVQPHKAIVFPFTLTVPSTAAPGDYAGGIVALDEQPTVSKDGPINIKIQRAVGARIYVHVIGATHPGIAITGIRTSAHRTGLAGALWGKGTGTVTVRIENTGNSIFQRVTTSLSVTGLLGGHVGSFTPNVIEDLLPGSSVEVQIPWKDIPHLDAYHLHASVATSGGTPPQPSARASALYWDVPILPFIIVILLIISPFAWRYWRRFRERPREAEAAAGGGPGGPGQAGTGNGQGALAGAGTPSGGGAQTGPRSVPTIMPSGGQRGGQT